MKKIYVALLLSLFLPLMAWSAAQDAVIKEMNIRLTTMEKTWNAGDLEAFLTEYAPSASTTYVSSSAIILGYNNIVKRFHTQYPTNAKMGHLVFSDITVKILSSNYVMVVGKWHLARKKDEDIGGVFSVLYEKTSAGWKIVVDHTS